jgi:uncharacterized membrane protein
MKHSHFIRQLDEPRILAAIAAAEAKTTGQIRALVSKRHCADPLAAAHKHFRALGLDKDPHHNGVLIFVAPKSHTFAIYGDTAVHERCGPEFWNTLRDEMVVHLKEGRYTDALLHAINKAGDLLAVHFPANKRDSGA